MAIVQLAWFSPNTLGVPQRVDQDIIQNVKVDCCKLLMAYLLSNIDSTSSASVHAGTASFLDVVIYRSQTVTDRHGT